MKTKLIKIGVLLLIALAVVLTVCEINGLLTEKLAPRDVMKVLCDAFFVSGVVFLGISGLAWASDMGAFDGIGYSISTMINTHMPAGRGLNWHKKESYEEYKERKHAPEKKKKLKASFIMGAFMLALAIVFLVVYLTA